MLDAKGGRVVRPEIGLVEWFRPGEYERVERVIADLRALDITQLRTNLSWADWHAPDGEAWYAWLIKRLAGEVNVLPCFMYTPPSLGIAPRVSSPPRDPGAYAVFVDEVISRFGEHFNSVELWSEANNLRNWDITLDRDWLIFSEMAGAVANWARRQGKKTVLAGMSPIDPNWLRLMFDRGVMAYIDVVGIHGFPGTFEFTWDGWDESVAKIRAVLEFHGSNAEVWITQAGFSTWRHDERGQLRAFVDVLQAPVERVYWYAAQDLDPAIPAVDGFDADQREYHFGLRQAGGNPKLLFNIWADGGFDAVRNATWLSEPVRLQRKDKRPVLITGGAGFVGTNLANRLLESGRSVLLFDNLSRPGVEHNLRWLRETHGEQVQIEVADVRDPFTLSRCVERASQVFHLAAQVAVTTSLTGPVYDFEVNVRGTINLLEALRALPVPPPLVFTSTNKVYGNLDNIILRADSTRYEPEDTSVGVNGVNEQCALDFHSPYGCSKGAADQYVLDYARIYGIPAVVFRMSCIYGPHQFGTEDQGWIAHFLIRAIEGKPITLYGNGLQVRDVLFVEDLVDAFLLAQSNVAELAGKAFNIGGGPENTVSLIEFLELLSELQGRKPAVVFDGWRPGDQKYYVSDTSKFSSATGWIQKVDVHTGVGKLYNWLIDTRGISHSSRKRSVVKCMAVNPR